MAKKDRNQRPESSASPGKKLSAGPAFSPSQVKQGLGSSAGQPVARPWRRLVDFFGFGGDVSYLWTRWLMLRAVGMVYVIIFAGIMVESQAIIGPDGVSPVADYLTAYSNVGAFRSFLAVPSLFWLNTSGGMITALEGVGLVAAVALVLNFWPRAALSICWVVFLSFVTTWAEFSPAQLDRLMLETALLCIPFAPRGIRPGLGETSPPHPLTVCMMRWLLFRVMFESGIVKIISTDPHWRELTAMDVMYETAPSPTIAGYWAHQLSHPWHVFEVFFTFAAELAAPLIAVFGGRRGRWAALCVWTAFQTGIQFTCNFGWLNTAGIGLGLLLLDDRMISTALAAGGFRKLRDFFNARSGTPAPRATKGWRHYGLGAALGLHGALTWYYFAEVCGLPVDRAPAVMASAVNLFVEFRSANGYFLYAYFPASHLQVDFEGSNDRGKTWRTYKYRHVPQRVDRAPSFLAPWFPRFEATIQIQSWAKVEFPVLPVVGRKILARSRPVIGRFEADPFPDRAPNVVRMRRYRLAFTDQATLRRTGNYWTKEFVNDYSPAMYVTEEGVIAQFNLDEADAALKAGNYDVGRALNERQFQLGNLEAGYRVAQMYIRGTGVPPQPERALALFVDLAERGELRARHNLGLCYEYGVGCAIDLPKAADQYRQAAARGSLRSLYALGVLYANDRVVPRDDVEGLSLLLRAAVKLGADPDDLREIAENEPALARQLMDRMSPADIARARIRATERLQAN